MPKISFFIIIISVIIGIIKSQYITLKFRTNLNLSTINEQNYMKSAVEQQIYVNLDIGQSNQINNSKTPFNYLNASIINVFLILFS